MKSAGGAGLAGAVDGDVHAGDFGAGREVPEFGRVKVRRWVGIDDFATAIAMEMDVLVQVGAVAGLAALELDLTDQAVSGEMLQAIVNGGQRDAGGALLHLGKKIVSRRVIGGLGEGLKDLTAMRGQPRIGAQNGQATVQTGGFGGRAWRGGCHSFRIRIRMILIFFCYDLGARTDSGENPSVGLKPGFFAWIGPL